MTDSRNFVSWLHIGDLHASDEDGWQSIETLKSIVAQVNGEVAQGALDFAYLPGDTANHAEPEQYRRVAEALAPLALPLHAVPGDHDFERGSLDDFHRALGTPRLPAVVHVGGRRALFLDIVSAGSGGPDFRLGAAQTTWLRTQLAASNAAREPRPLVFMHAFPEDLRDGAAEIGQLLARSRVGFVDTGHTHYNELLNDGSVIYSATRSTGQIEEGDAGFSIAAVDGDAASWRFKSLGSGWPWVLITSPADARLMTAGMSDTAPPLFEVRALVLGRDVHSVEVSVNEAAPVPMRAAPGRAGLWAAELELPAQGRRHRIRVRARDSAGETDSDDICFYPTWTQSRATTNGYGLHRHSIGTWVERGLLGTRLGPNANGRHW